MVTSVEKQPAYPQLVYTLHDRRFWTPYLLYHIPNALSNPLVLIAAVFYALI